MRSLLPCLLAALALAGGRSYEGDDTSNRGTGTPRACLEVEADQVEILVRLAVTAPTRAEADTRLRALAAKVNGRFENQEGLSLQRLEHDLARAKASSGSFLSKSDQEADGFVTASTWAFRADIGEDAAAAADRLRKLTADLVDPRAVKEETESLRVGEAAFRLSNPDDYRDDLLHRIREDAAAAASHLPAGENTLELPALEQRVEVVALGGNRIRLWLPYTLKHKSKVTGKDGRCGCEDKPEGETSK